MKYSTTTYLFITVLIGFVLFLGGFRLGKRIERFDRTYIAPTPSTAQIAPSITPTIQPITLKSITHGGCGIRFLYPANLQIIENSSDSAALKKNGESITFTCNPKRATESIFYLTPTPTIVNNYKILLYPSTPDMTLWTTKKNNKTLYFVTSINLTDLVMQTLSTLTP